MLDLSRLASKLVYSNVPRRLDVLDIFVFVRICLPEEFVGIVHCFDRSPEPRELDGLEYLEPAAAAVSFQCVLRPLEMFEEVLVPFSPVFQ